MKHNIFETRQRADELLKEAMAIWQLSDRSDSLAGLEDDPVFHMLINAIAYQSIQMDSDIEQLKVELLEEFQKTVVIGEGNKAIPATTVLSMKPVEKISHQDVTSRMKFVLKGVKRSFSFIPVLNTTVYNADVASITRLDRRRWSVKLDFYDPVENLQGMSFMISGSTFRNIKVMMADSHLELPLIAPWDYADLPLSEAFSLDTLLYNRRQAVSIGNSRNVLTPYFRNCAMDIFARQEADLFVIDNMPDIEQHMHIDLIVEVDGASESFDITTSNFFINAVILANATIEHANISSRTPVVRIAGMSGKSDSGQFMHLLRPDEEQIFRETPLEVRRIYADRFNSGRLQKLMHNLLDKYNSDYYAFQEFGNGESDAIIRQVRTGMKRLEEMASSQSDTYEGVYLILTHQAKELSSQSISKQDISLTVKYLTTDGAAPNHDLSSLPGGKTTVGGSAFDAPEGIDKKSLRQIATPHDGMNEVYDDNAEATISRYFNATDDRLVTPADIKLFCLTELSVHYGITRGLVNRIRISRGQHLEGNYRTYLTTVTISLHDNIFVQRAMANKLLTVQHYLQRMIEVRTNGMYPVEVKLSIG